MPEVTCFKLLFLYPKPATIKKSSEKFGVKYPCKVTTKIFVDDPMITYNNFKMSNLIII